MRPLMLSNSGSFFWRHILKLKSLFHICAQFQLNSGMQTSFWFDGWAGQALASQFSGPLQRRAISIFDAKNCFNQLMPRPLTLLQHGAYEKIVHFMPLQDRDKLIWNITPSSQFTVKSFDKLLSQGGRIRTLHLSIWKANVTPSMKLFFFFLLNDRLLTYEVMQRRHLNFTPGCVLCHSASSETAMHLFFVCSFAQTIWSALSSQEGYILAHPRDTPSNTYMYSAPRDKGRRKQWTVTFITAAWFLWRKRNNRIFRHDVLPNCILLDRIRQESALCLKYC